MHRGIRLLSGTLTLALVAASATAVFAEKLDKSACKHLRIDLADMLASGIEKDMERGSEWAKANLAPAQLADIKRFLQLQDQLEFRCGLSRKRIVATKPAKKPVIPDMPQRKLDDLVETKAAGGAQAPARPSANPVRTVTRAEIKAKEAAHAKESAKPKEKKAKEKKTATASPAPAPATTAAVPQPPAPAATASKRSARRRPSSAYMSPTDVNPDLLTRFGDSR